MSKLGWFIGGALAGVAGTIAAAYFLDDDTSSYSSSDEDDDSLESSGEAISFDEAGCHRDSDKGVIGAIFDTPEASSPA